MADYLEPARLRRNPVGLNHSNEDGDVPQRAALPPCYTHAEGVADSLRGGERGHLLEVKPERRESFWHASVCRAQTPHLTTFAPLAPTAQRLP